MSDKDFQTLDEAWLTFARSALHEYTPAKVKRSIQGGFYAGAQATIVLINEAYEAYRRGDENARSYEEVVNALMSESQAFMLLAKAAKESEKKPKDKDEGATS